MRPLIVCPLQFERARVLRAGAARWCDVTCCGLGAEGVRRWAHQLELSPERPVILTGVAGSLVESIGVGAARVVTSVVSSDGRTRLRPALGADRSPCTITSTGAVVGGSDERRALRETSGADLVDLESVTFAAIAEQARWRWAIVRGVSDDPDRELPAASADLVSPSGRTRPLRLVAALVRRPALAADLVALRRLGIDAMDEAVTLIEALTGPDEKTAGSSPP